MPKIRGHAITVEPILNSLRAPLVILDSRRLVCAANQEFARVSTISLNNCLGRPFASFFNAAPMPKRAMGYPLTFGIRSFALRSSRLQGLAGAERLTLIIMDELPRAHNATSTSAGPRLEDLTPRERETLLLITDGVRNRDIAQRLRIGLRTVESHRQRLMMKLGVNSSAALTKLAIARGWIRAS